MLKVGYVGLGHRGIYMLKAISDTFDDVEITCICDLSEERLKEGKELLIEKTGREPLTTKDVDELLNMDIDCIMIMAYWEAHIPLAIKAMEKGIKVGVEVGGAYSIHDCYKLVDAYERTGIHAMMLENCCYGRRELGALKAAREGLFGEVVHCSGGYHHDLKGEIAYGKEKYHYRLRNYISRNCENYPTHQLGPIAKILNINRGNRFLSLTKSVALGEYVKQHLEDLPYLKNTKFNQGDVITTVIKCANGETIVLTLDTTLPRVYSRGFTVRGTKGAYFEDTDSFFFEDNADHKEAERMFDWSTEWKNAVTFREKNPHPLWEKYGDIASKTGHDGMDYMVLAAFFESVKKNATPPIDTYDTATWMAITPLSEESIAKGSAPVYVPDFTTGKWAMDREKCNLEFSLD